MSIKVLVVDDEAAIAEVLTLALEAASFDTRTVFDGKAVLASLTDYQPDVLLLDWMLPNISGIELARQIKQHPDFKQLPIIMLTARGEEESKIMGLETGADDYVTKPFSTRELISRIKAVLRRGSPELLAGKLVHGELVLELASQRVKAGEQELTLGPTEYRLLEWFMRNPDRVFSREQLLDRVWGSQVYVEDRTVDVHILRLRKVLKTAQLDHLIETVRGSGYRFSAS